MTAARPLLVVGGGKMGGALMAGWISRGIPAAGIFVVEPNLDNASALVRDLGVTVAAAADDLPPDFLPELVMFAVKPQVMADVVPAYLPFAGPATVFLSIAAGTPIALFEDCLGEVAAIVRVMPNTPAAVGRGASVAGQRSRGRANCCTDRPRTHPIPCAAT